MKYSVYEIIFFKLTLAYFIENHLKKGSGFLNDLLRIGRTWVERNKEKRYSKQYDQSTKQNLQMTSEKTTQACE